MSVHLSSVRAPLDPWPSRRPRARGSGGRGRPAGAGHRVGGGNGTVSVPQAGL